MAEHDNEEFDLSDAEVRIMKAFVRLTDRDQEQLKSLRNKFAAIAPDVIADFYDHLNAQPQIAEFLRDPTLVARLKQVQLGHFSELFAGDYGVDYCRKRLEVGRNHEQIGLEPQQTVGAYSVLLQLCCEHLGGQIPPAFLSLTKVILLEIALSVQAYHAASTQRLRRRNDELERALRMYHEIELKADGFAKLAGHEIRNSLNAIANACDEVAEDFAEQIPNEARDTLEAASERSWQLVNVVEQILSSPDVGGTPKWVEATEIIDEIRDRIPLHADGKTIEFHTFDSPVRVWAEPVGLREVFSNLVSNAIHHLDNPHGTVEVEYEARSGEHVFSVTDNGPGIPVEFQQQVFQPFFRGTATDKRAGKGLGLYFVRQIVERHGGRVWVDSVPGPGSRFSFSLRQDPQTEVELNEAGGAV